MRSVIALCLLPACIEFDGGQSPPSLDASNDGAPVSDGPGNDALIDAPLGCAADFQIISGGQANHRYRAILTSDTWADQHNIVCVSQGAYLAIPDDAGELMALEAIAGSIFWVGVSDQATEDEPRDVLGNAYTALTISGNLSADDCVLFDNISLDYESCSIDAPAVCECEEP